MNKKAISQGVLSILIIGLVVFWVTSSFAGELVSLLIKGGEIESCRASVIAQAKSKTLGSSPINLDCPRRLVRVFEDKVEVNGKPSRNYRPGILDNDAVNKVVAEELRLCWYKLGEGRLDLFEQRWAFSSDLNCIVCAELEFDKNVGSREFTGLYDYIKNNNIPRKSTSYEDYLSSPQEIPYGIDGVGYLPFFSYTQDSKKFSVTSIKSDTRPVIYFLAFKTNLIDDWVGAAENAYWVGIGPPEQIVKNCQTLVN